MLNLQLQKTFFLCIAMETGQNLKYDCVSLEAIDENNIRIEFFDTLEDDSWITDQVATAN